MEWASYGQGEGPQRDGYMRADQRTDGEDKERELEEEDGGDEGKRRMDQVEVSALVSLSQMEVSAWESLVGEWVCEIEEAMEERKGGVGGGGDGVG